MTKKKTATPKIGAPLAGGFFAGDITVDDVRYALIVAPKAEGEKLSLEYKSKKLNAYDGTDSDDEGMLNSEKINDGNHPAAQFCSNLRLGDHDDWYLPSRDELMRIWMAFGANRKNTPEPFRKGGGEAFEDRWYWSSTESASYSGLAWMVGFYDGGQDLDGKSGGFAVRAVRRLPI